MKQIILAITIIISIVSCQKEYDSPKAYALAEVEEEMMPITYMESPKEPNDIPNKEDKVDKKKIIKDGRIGIEVSELEVKKHIVDSIVIKYDAYYANDSYENTDWESSYSLKIRIPSISFEHFIKDIESGNGKILYKEIDARDVTTEFIDLESRLGNKKNYLKRYNDLLIQAKNVKEILEIEEKIRVLEEEIESTTGKLKYLIDLVDFSTLELSISKPKDFKYNPDDRDKFTEQLKQSLSKGWYGFVDLLLFMIKIWPTWILVFVIIFLWKRYKIKKKLKN